MQILHILYSGMGGHGNVFFSLIRADTEQQFRYEALFNGVERVREEYITNCNQLGIPWSYVSKKPGLHLAYYFQLIKKIKNSDAEIIFLHSSAYIFPARLGKLFSKTKKKIIVRETQANNLKTKTNWFWLLVTMLFADTIVFLSEEYKEEIAKCLKWVYKKKKVQVIPNGLDLILYKPEQKNDSSTVVIGMQSRLVKIKDHITLLKAFAELIKEGDKKIILKIAGDGDQKNELLKESAALQLNSRVEFTGMLAENELIDLMRSLNIYVHASMGETMSTAIMQAMASGKPIVASDVPGIKNMISNNETGLLVPVKNSSALTGAMQQLISNNELALRLGANAYRYAQDNFSNLTMFNRYKQIFNY